MFNSVLRRWQNTRFMTRETFTSTTKRHDAVSRLSPSPRPFTSSPSPPSFSRSTPTPPPASPRTHRRQLDALLSSSEHVVVCAVLRVVAVLAALLRLRRAPLDGRAEQALHRELPRVRRRAQPTDVLQQTHIYKGYVLTVLVCCRRFTSFVSPTNLHLSPHTHTHTHTHTHKRARRTRSQKVSFIRFNADSVLAPLCQDLEGAPRAPTQWISMPAELFHNQVQSRFSELVTPQQQYPTQQQLQKLTARCAAQLTRHGILRKNL